VWGECQRSSVDGSSDITQRTLSWPAQPAEIELFNRANQFGPKSLVDFADYSKANGRREFDGYVTPLAVMPNV
jgi:hypothetical protein